MKTFHFIILIGLCFFFYACGNLSKEDLDSKEASKFAHDSIWGKATDLTPSSVNDIVKKWIVRKGTWEVKDGKLETVKNESDKNQEYIILFKTNKVGDFAIEFKASVKNEEALKVGGDLSIIMSANSTLNKRYDIQLGGIGNRFAVIQMYNLPIAQTPYKLEPKKVYRIRVERIGDQFKLYCNNKLLLSCKNQYFLTGRFNGIYTYGMGKQFWDIKLYERKMRNYDIELKSVDRILSKVIHSTNKYRKFAETVRMLYDEILLAYSEEKILISRIYTRLAYLELALENYTVANKHIDKIAGRDYDVLILKAKSAFMSGNLQESKKHFSTCMTSHPELRVGTMGVLKSLLQSKFSRNLTPEYQSYFWNKYTDYSIDNKLNCTFSNLKNIDFLKSEEPKITSIDLGYNEISSLEPLSNYKKLSYLSLNENFKIFDLKMLNNISVSRLTIDSTNITSLDGINKIMLKSLAINFNNFNDLSILKGCENLVNLEAQSNDIISLNELSKLKFLRNIDLSGNKIFDISSINLQSIKTLNLYNNLVVNVDLLANAKKLLYLNLYGNKVQTVDKLSENKQLDTVIINKNPITSFGNFAATPPKTFFFSIDMLSDKYIEDLLKKWSRNKYYFHKKNLEILKELKKGNSAYLKKFADKKNGHYYLCVPVFLNLKDTKKFCKNHGGHLISIVDKYEMSQELLKRMPFNAYRIGLEEISNSLKWSTGESLKVDQSIYKNSSKISKDSYYILDSSNQWQTHNPLAKIPFIIEWDN